MSRWHDLLMLDKLRAPVGNMQILIRILHVQSADPHYTRSQPHGTQLAHYKLGQHKSTIRPRSSVAYMSVAVSKTV